MALPAADIPKGSTILVTGVSGYIATHVAQQLFDWGYKVRGTARDVAKVSWLKEDNVFGKQFAAGNFELVQVPDMAAPGAWDEAVRGVAGVVAVAAILTFDRDPNKVIPASIDSTLLLLRAAAAEKSVRSFVFTSSSGAAITPEAGSTGHIGRDTWNEAEVAKAWAPAPYEEGRQWNVYMASKVASEKAVWKFIEEEKPPYRVNVVLPYTTMGHLFHESHLSGTAGWIPAVWKGNASAVGPFNALIWSNVKDVAALHAAALLDADVEQERIMAWARSFNWNDVLAIMRRLYPNRKFVDDLPGQGKILTTFDTEVPLRLLKKWAGQDDFLSLEQTVQEAVAGL